MRSRVCLKPSNDQGGFELDRARSKTNIAEYSIALGHETHNICKRFGSNETQSNPKSRSDLSYLTFGQQFLSKHGEVLFF